MRCLIAWIKSPGQPQSTLNVRDWHIATARHVAFTAANGGRTDMGQGAPKMTFLTRLYGPTVLCKRTLMSRWWAVLHLCIRPLIGALLRAIKDISARVNSLADRP